MDQPDLPPPSPTAATRARIAFGRARALGAQVWREHRPLVIGAGATLAIVLAAGGLFWGRCGWAGCPNVDRLRSYQPGKASRLLDRHGRVFADLRPVEGATVPLRLIPKHVRDAFLAVEDQRFYSTAASIGGAWPEPPSPTSGAAASIRVSAPSPCSSRATSSPIASARASALSPARSWKCAWPTRSRIVSTRTRSSSCTSVTSTSGMARAG